MYGVIVNAAVSPRGTVRRVPSGYSTPKLGTDGAFMSGPSGRTHVPYQIAPSGAAARLWVVMSYSWNPGPVHTVVVVVVGAFGPVLVVEDDGAAVVRVADGTDGPEV